MTKYKTMQQIHLERAVERAIIDTETPIFITLRFKSDKSDKFYGLYVSATDGDGTINYGKWPIGLDEVDKNRGRILLKRNAEMVDLFREKVRKGYVIYGFDYLKHNKNLYPLDMLPKHLHCAFRISRKTPNGDFLEHKAIIYDRSDGIVTYIPLEKIEWLVKTFKFPCELIDI